MNTMFEINKEMTKKKCNECGEVKSDVEFRTWDGIDAAEWDIICADCEFKKKRGMKAFWILFTSMIVMGFVMLTSFAAAIIFT